MLTELEITVRPRPLSSVELFACKKNAKNQARDVEVLGSGVNIQIRTRDLSTPWPAWHDPKTTPNCAIYRPHTDRIQTVIQTVAKNGTDVQTVKH